MANNQFPYFPTTERAPLPSAATATPTTKAFENSEFGRLDIITIDGVQWLIGKQAATMLGYTDTKQAVRDHVDADDKRLLTYAEIQRCQINTFASPRGLMLINEFGFNALVMRSKLEAAKRIQRWVTHDVMPSIRRTGAYALPSAPMPTARPSKLVTAIDDMGLIAGHLESLLGATRGIALSKAMTLVEQAYGVNLIPLRELLPPAEDDVGLFNPTEIGKQVFNVTGKVINARLVELGLQERIGKGYRLTEAGKEYGEMMPYTCNGHSGWRPLWRKRLIDYLKRLGVEYFCKSERADVERGIYPPRRCY